MFPKCTYIITPDPGRVSHVFRLYTRFRFMRRGVRGGQRHRWTLRLLEVLRVRFGVRCCRHAVDGDAWSGIIYGSLVVRGAIRLFMAFLVAFDVR